jgi:MFS transporter, DHA2 family, multidrug resistance protein
VAASATVSPTRQQAGPNATPAPATANRFIITVCTVVATLMQSLDSTIANVALP